jgi:hypothetical protein
MSADKFWMLLALQLSGEASEEQLHELENLVGQSPELIYYTETVSAWWNCSVCSNNADADRAVERLLTRIALEQVK